MSLTKKITKGFILAGDTYEIHATHLIEENKVDFHWCFKNYNVLDFIIGVSLDENNEETFEEVVDNLLKNGYLFDAILADCVSKIERESFDSEIYWDEYDLAIKTLREFGIEIKEEDE